MRLKPSASPCLIRAGKPELDKGLTLTHFVIDWERQVVTCPMQQRSHYWYESRDDQGKPVIRVEFSKDDCHLCPHRLLCTKNQTGGRRISLRPKPEYEALQRLRQQVHTEDFKASYRKRAGIEGTLSLAVRVADLRRARYTGLAKVHLQHVATAAAVNLAKCLPGYRTSLLLKPASLPSLPCSQRLLDSPTVSFREGTCRCLPRSLNNRHVHVPSLKRRL